MRWRIPLLAVLTLFVAVSCDQQPVGPNAEPVAEVVARSHDLPETLGNVIDRAMLGYVVDFISVHRGTWYFPAFNVADSAIFVGAVLLIYDAITNKEASNSEALSKTDAEKSEDPQKQ